MKILFVFSGNKPSGISAIIKNQGNSLFDHGIEIDFFPIIGKGVVSYLRHIPVLKKLLKSHRFDIVHAHYSFSAYAASLAGAKPLVVSLMGSDVNNSWPNAYVIKLFAYVFQWKSIIVKSEDLKLKSGFKNAIVIPNGVDLNRFKPLDNAACKQKLLWENDKKYILFAADPHRREKNFFLAKEAFQKLGNESVLMQVLLNVPYKDIPVWINAAKVVILTSFWEGSPNVIKEALACNRPIVSTDVGDVRILMENVEGCFIAKPDSVDIAGKISQAMHFENAPNGRQRIIDLGLELNTIAAKIIDVYHSVLRGSSCQ
jgi:glycosyltransferase involved in cell wall biosynthesis